MGTPRRRRQLVAGGVLLGLSLSSVWLGVPVSARWPSASLTVGFVSFGLFLVALWLFLLVIAERDDPPGGTPGGHRSPSLWPFQRRQAPIPRDPHVAPVVSRRRHAWVDRVVPVLRRVDADETLEHLLVDDRGDGPIGPKREIVVAFSTQDLLMMSAALQANAEDSGAPDPAREIGFAAPDALAWSRRAARAARDAPAPRPDPASTAAVGARRIAWTAWALEQDAGGGDVDVDVTRDPWFVVPLDQLEAVTGAVEASTEGHAADRVDRVVAAELARRLRTILLEARESDPTPTSGSTTL
ncbi:hypothetical protein [Frigoribacterium sp. VKM Ac-2836]|uniref:hypothetical protein n=1 Tax=Frigoribacterium sp. VKM Ac-2836 TaxID=2739014 RepID=UPI001566A23A|nr:hypothetical protein [Frigoribacterium sp. VKM Ac-2836]NRD26788.1 hypothetical protein [Frigoribacterium sp. VKM Ac-2836]